MTPDCRGGDATTSGGPGGWYQWWAFDFRGDTAGQLKLNTQIYADYEVCLTAIYHSSTDTLYHGSPPFYYAFVQACDGTGAQEWQINFDWSIESRYYTNMCLTSNDQGFLHQDCYPGGCTHIFLEHCNGTAHIAARPQPKSGRSDLYTTLHCTFSCKTSTEEREI